MKNLVNCAEKRTPRLCRLPTAGTVSLRIMIYEYVEQIPRARGPRRFGGDRGDACRLCPSFQSRRVRQVLPTHREPGPVEPLAASGASAKTDAPYSTLMRVGDFPPTLRRRQSGSKNGDIWVSRLAKRQDLSSSILAPSNGKAAWVSP
jgi:hypothetical protein